MVISKLFLTGIFITVLACMVMSALSPDRDKLSSMTVLLIVAIFYIGVVLTIASIFAGIWAL